MENHKFNKSDNIINGKHVETFYIDDKQVSESTYYSMLDELTVNNNIKSASIPELSNEQNEYIQSILDDIYDSPEHAINILYHELIHNYKIGFYTGQMELNNEYAKAMKNNYRISQSKIDDVMDEYEK
ncbi:MAG: hypothetical protein ACM3O3_12860 [Syntrophothermus sp.]